MYIETQYLCEVCGRTYYSREECERCEANHPKVGDEAKAILRKLIDDLDRIIGEIQSVFCREAGDFCERCALGTEACSGFVLGFYPILKLAGVGNREIGVSRK